VAGDALNCFDGNACSRDRGYQRYRMPDRTVYSTNEENISLEQTL
jgi:hypothetical protein